MGCLRRQAAAGWPLRVSLTGPGLGGDRSRARAGQASDSASASASSGCAWPPPPSRASPSSCNRPRSDRRDHPPERSRDVPVAVPARRERLRRRRRLQPLDRRRKPRAPGAGHPEVEHTLVLTHPVTGARSLLLCSIVMSGITGLAEKESRPCSTSCRRTQPAPYVHSHRWKQGDLVMWDNLATLHTASPATVPATAGCCTAPPSDGRARVPGGDRPDRDGPAPTAGHRVRAARRPVALQHDRRWRRPAAPGRPRTSAPGTGGTNEQRHRVDVRPAGGGDPRAGLRRRTRRRPCARCARR
ncbi:TauD/TfdA family dioxygenase [Streptomyces sp. NPDC005706]|uniref:TauD/TfdA dioxygenase family protein n=1 Tax=Streptomyces sp. NPDC005706 TaxID=3157169 RepID=UPI0033E1C956